ncbi:putative metal homeostasis protein [Pediococcus pentosaceus]|nr:putative metal homeostasis protein [Pediococcus pentosaceus]MBF7102141.1 putative metal homeostasis protein [Pediococcus pentosaceus]
MKKENQSSAYRYLKTPYVKTKRRVLKIIKEIKKNRTNKR